MNCSTNSAKKRERCIGLTDNRIKSTMLITYRCYKFLIILISARVQN